jgi:acylglycerol lipase
MAKPSTSKVDDGVDVGDYEYEEEFIKNARGMKLFTCRWLPKARPIKALVFICHGTFQLIPRSFFEPMTYD